MGSSLDEKHTRFCFPKEAGTVITFFDWVALMLGQIFVM